MNKRGKGEEFVDIGLLYAEYKWEVYAFFLVRTEDRSVAEDLTQDVFVRAIQYEHTVLDISKAKHWIFKIAQNVYKSYYEKRKKELSMVIQEKNKKKISVFDYISNEELIEEIVIQKENLKILKRTLESLSEEEKLLIQFRFFDYKSFKEISYIIGVNENAARVRLYRILKKCREIYEDMEKKGE